MSLSSLVTCGVYTGQTWPFYLAVSAASAHMFNQVSKKVNELTINYV